MRGKTAATSPIFCPAASWPQAKRAELHVLELPAMPSCAQIFSAESGMTG